MTQPMAGWYPDPSDPSRQRYFDGRVWTENYAPFGAPPPGIDSATQPAKRQRNWKVLAVIGAGLLVLIVIANIGDDKGTKSTATSSITTTTGVSSVAPIAAPPMTPTPTPTPTGPVVPEGVNFHSEPGESGEVVFADFDIGDALFMTLTKFGAQSKTKDILQYARTVYPQASKVVVQGRFPTKDAYGNEENSVVLNVIYTRETLDKINFAGIDNDKIWVVRDGGFVHPDLQ